jgi:uncharacterized protein YndB with AHSA1/START domain
MTDRSQAASIVVRRTFSASPHELFEYWTQPELLVRWLSGYTGPVDCEAHVEPRVGGRIRLRMRSGEEQCEIVGRYVEFEPPNRLAFTWQGAPTDNQETLVTVEFRATTDGTEILLTHERLPNAASRDNHAAGWAVVFDHLRDALVR